MLHDPKLAAANWNDGNRRYDLIVTGGLHYIRGNSAPHFTITADLRENGREYACGCLHDDIEARFPGRFTDLIAMHLSDIDGVPMHHIGNGWYDLAGALGGAGEQYHVGNSQRHFPITPDPATPWKTTEYRNPTEAECLQIFADHSRIPLAEARAIADAVRVHFGPPQESAMVSEHGRADYKRGRAVWERYALQMLPRFKREADACIARHSLVVFGDKWERSAA